jgi:predicted nucleic acid-binding protein
MIVITDVNKIFSATYTPNGIEANMLASKGGIQFLAPDYLIEEFENHIDEISESMGYSKRDTKKLFLKVVTHIRLVEITKIPKELVIQAVEIVRDIDPNDAAYVALQLFQGHKIWTGDKALISGLKRKDYDICITTPQLRKYLYKK